jgi:hypothetical protein
MAVLLLVCMCMSVRFGTHMHTHTHAATPSYVQKSGRILNLDLMPLNYKRYADVCTSACMYYHTDMVWSPAHRHRVRRPLHLPARRRHHRTAQAAAHREFLLSKALNFQH